MVPVNLHQLYYFWVITKSGSITAATKCLFLTQSTLSKQVKQLELSLGKRLFMRGRHGITLTGEGRLAFDYCDRVFPQIEELTSLLRSDGAARSPMIRLGVGRSIARDKVLSLTRFVKGLPERVSAKVVSATVQELKEMYSRREVDVILSDSDLSSSLGRDCRARLVARNPHYFVASAAIKTKRWSFPGILSDMPLVLRPVGYPVRKEVDFFLRSHGITPIIAAEVDSPDLILSMVLAGEGIGVLDPSAVRREIGQGKIIKLHPRPAGIFEHLWLQCSQQMSALAPVQSGIDALMSKFRLDDRG